MVDLLSDYIVLTDKNASLRSSAGISGGMAQALRSNPRSFHDTPPDLAFKQGALSAQDVGGLLRDPSTVALARPMPLKLIEPLATGSAQTQFEGQAAWGIHAVGALDTTLTGDGVTVAVLDTGIDPNHPAFQGVELIRQNFTTDQNPDDGNGHGTHCAGTIFGRDVDGVRIGVAPGIRKAVIGKVLDSQGAGGSTAQLVAAMHWAALQGANVISMSLGIDVGGMLAGLEREMPKPAAASLLVAISIENARLFDRLLALLSVPSLTPGSNPLVFAASGNESKAGVQNGYRMLSSLPASTDEIYSVGALAQTNNGLVPADFSNTNVTLSAPGVQVASAKVGGGLVALDGTSMACPHVAGAAALWFEAVMKRGLPPRADVVWAQMIAAASFSKIAPNQSPFDVGVGCVQVPQSVNQIAQAGVAAAPSPQSPQPQSIQPPQPIAPPQPTATPGQQPSVQPPSPSQATPQANPGASPNSLRDKVRKDLEDAKRKAQERLGGIKKQNVCFMCTGSGSCFYCGGTGQIMGSPCGTCNSMGYCATCNGSGYS